MAGRTFRHKSSGILWITSLDQTCPPQLTTKYRNNLYTPVCTFTLTHLHLQTYVYILPTSSTPHHSLFPNRCKKCLSSPIRRPSRSRRRSEVSEQQRADGFAAGGQALQRPEGGHQAVLDWMITAWGCEGDERCEERRRKATALAFLGQLNLS